MRPCRRVRRGPGRSGAGGSADRPWRPVLRSAGNSGFSASAAVCDESVEIRVRRAASRPGTSAIRVTMGAPVAGSRTASAAWRASGDQPGGPMRGPRHPWGGSGRFSPRHGASLTVVQNICARGQATDRRDCRHTRPGARRSARSSGPRGPCRARHDGDEPVCVGGSSALSWTITLSRSDSARPRVNLGLPCGGRRSADRAAPRAPAPPARIVRHGPPPAPRLHRAESGGRSRRRSAPARADRPRAMTLRHPGRPATPRRGRERVAQDQIRLRWCPTGRAGQPLSGRGQDRIRRKGW